MQLLPRGAAQSPNRIAQAKPEALMAKEQRSTKEKRKPKKAAADKKGGKK
ncbi:MAG: hypothetical protein ABL897_10845 [Hyphomicrobium sp.]